MKRLALAFAAASLAACAAPPESASPAAQPQAVQPPAVSLEVIEDYAAEAVGALKSPYVGQPVVQVAVNLSAHQFRQPDLGEQVVAALDTHGIPPELLELELTESAVMHHAEATIETLMQLHKQGVRLAIDDFGTGYSSLSYLKKFPLDKLKIDRSFVMDIDTNPASAEIVGAIVAMGHSLNLEIVAEGVENDAQLDVLKGLKCDEIQGFYYSRPIPAETFASILRLGRIDGHATAAE